MEFYDFRKETGLHITMYESDFILSRIARNQTPTSIGVMHLYKNGLIGYHQATKLQLLLILSGEGYVCSESKEFYKVKQGVAVFWNKDEWHETKTEHGMTALVIESDELNPSAYMAVANMDL
ncbi:cupin [Heyndrickxia sp. MSNUG]|uniref:cupin n=1 Tax=Heyndrickxia sp. MSNUG TaxID=3136677 RepID=UPI003C2DE7AC